MRTRMNVSLSLSLSPSLSHSLSVSLSPDVFSKKDFDILKWQCNFMNSSRGIVDTFVECYVVM